MSLVKKLSQILKPPTSEDDDEQERKPRQVTTIHRSKKVQSVPIMKVPRRIQSLEVSHLNTRKPTTPVVTSPYFEPNEFRHGVEDSLKQKFKKCVFSKEHREGFHHLCQKEFNGENLRMLRLLQHSMKLWEQQLELIRKMEQLIHEDLNFESKTREKLVQEYEIAEIGLSHFGRTLRHSEDLMITNLRDTYVRYITTLEIKSTTDDSETRPNASTSSSPNPPASSFLNTNRQPLSTDPLPTTAAGYIQPNDKSCEPFPSHRKRYSIVII